MKQQRKLFTERKNAIITKKHLELRKVREEKVE